VFARCGRIAFIVSRAGKNIDRQKEEGGKELEAQAEQHKESLKSAQDKLDQTVSISYSNI